MKQAIFTHNLLNIRKKKEGNAFYFDLISIIVSRYQGPLFSRIGEKLGSRENFKKSILS